MAKKATLVCKPCGTRVMVTDLGAAVIECYECGMELQSAAKAPKKALAAKPAAKKKAPPKKAAPKKRK
jgi:ribosomal protein L37AE/L43A